MHQCIGDRNRCLAAGKLQLSAELTVYALFTGINDFSEGVIWTSDLVPAIPGLFPDGFPKGWQNLDENDVYTYKNTSTLPFNAFGSTINYVASNEILAPINGILLGSTTNEMSPLTPFVAEDFGNGVSGVDFRVP